MKSPVVDQKSVLASASSRVESSWRGFGEESSSDSPPETSCSSLRPGRSLIKVDGRWRLSPPGVLTVPSATGNVKLSPFVSVHTPFAFEPSVVDFWCVHFLQFFYVCDHNVSFPDSPRAQCITEEQRNTPGKTFGRNWCNRNMSFAEVGWYSRSAPNGITSPLNAIPNRLSCGVFPSDKRSWMFRR